MNQLLSRIAVSVAAALSLAAQAPPPLVESIEVNVVNVDVVVTDKSGKRITGLTSDDFEIFDRGKRRAITNFSEFGAPPSSAADAAASRAAAPAPMRRRNTVIFFIDSTSVDPRRRHAVFEQMRTFAGAALQPGDRAMVATWNQRLRITQPFIDSAEEIQRTLAEAGDDAAGFGIVNNRRRTQQLIEGELDAGIRGVIPMGAAYANACMHAEAYAEEMFAHSRNLTIGVSRVLDTFAAPEDKKILVYVGDYLPQNAGAEMWQLVEDLFATRLDLRREVHRRRAAPIATWLASLVRSANASGVTTYMISGGGGLHQLNVDASESEPFSATAQNVLEAETHVSFTNTAELTGGVAFTGGDPRLVLKKIADDFHSYYSIGFSPDGKADGKERRIEVRAKNPRYVVRYRQSYVLRSTADEVADRVAANVYQAEAAGELVVRADADAAIDEGRNRIRVPVKVRVEGRNVALIPRDGALAGDLTVFVCGGSAKAGTSEVLRHSQRLNIALSDEARFRAGHLTFTFDVILERKEKSTISAGVLDTVSGSWGLARADSL